MPFTASRGRNEYVMRFKVAEQEDMKKGFDIHDEVKRRRARSSDRLKSSASRSSTARMQPNTPIATASNMMAT